jgi:prepilin-type processing-associated H-X9-DG protein
VFIDILPYLEQGNLFSTYNYKVPNYMPGYPQNQAFAQQYVATYTCPSDTRAKQLLAPQTLAPDGGGQPSTPLLYMTSSYKFMSGLGRYDNSYCFSGYWDTVQSALAYYPNGKGAFHTDGYSGLSPTKLADITDGTSNTLFIGERHMLNRPIRGPFWADSFNLYVGGGAYPYVVPSVSFYLSVDYEKCAANTNENFCKYGWGSFHAGNINFVFGDGSVRSISQNVDAPIFMALATIAGGEVTPASF